MAFNRPSGTPPRRCVDAQTHPPSKRALPPTQNNSAEANAALARKLERVIEAKQLALLAAIRAARAELDRREAAAAAAAAAGGGAGGGSGGSGDAAEAAAEARRELRRASSGSLRSRDDEAGLS